MGSGWDTIEVHAGFKVKGAVKALPSYVNEAKHILSCLFHIQAQCSLEGSGAWQLIFAQKHMVK